MEQIISKGEIDELMKFKGEVRAAGMKGYVKFILKEEGEEGLKKLEDTMASFGYSIKSKEIGTRNYYPIGLWALFLLVIKRLFDWNDEKFQEMGRFALKTSFLTRTFMKYFVSVERLAKEVPKIWRTTYTVGELKVTEFSQEERYIILKLENFRFHPLQCEVLMGVLSGIVQMMVGSKATSKEKKCIHGGDEYHEFLVKW